MIRRICVVTGTRAEYGLLYWLMREIEADPTLELQLIVTGMHLSPEFGLTYKTIEADGFFINEKVEMLLSSDSPVGIAKSIGLGVIGFADALNRLRPDILLLLGDRYEIFAAAQAALVAQIPIAHLHGGETTEGAIDEAMRHSITKMAHFHFVANDIYAKRVMQLGEEPSRVFNFGAVGLDNIKRLKLLNRTEFETAIDFQLREINFLVTYHPVTLSKIDSGQAMTELLTALDRYPQAGIIFTKPNSDTDGRKIIQMIDHYAAKAPARCRVFTSLGQMRYLSAISHVDVVIGNSSSGLIEVPAFHKPTVNIGDRQKGRLKATSIIDCPEETQAIIYAIERALSQDFQKTLLSMESPYEQGDTSSRIVQKLKSLTTEDVLMKRFYDIEV